MTSFLKLLHYTTRTHTLRYALRSREIYTEEPIASPEILSEPPQTEDDSVNSIQETPNTQFRLVLSVTPCTAQRSPRIRRRHNLHNYASLASTNGSYNVRSSVGAPPPDTPTSVQLLNWHKSLVNISNSKGDIERHKILMS